MLVDDGGAGPSSPWEKSPVPAEHQIRGLGPIVLNVANLARTEQMLTDVMNMRRERDYAAPDAAAQVHVFAMGEGGLAAELHVIEQKDLQPARQGAGGVHHVAFRTPDSAQYEAWAKRLNELDIRNSGEVDRFYFRSLYFREPNGILFEIATDGPGFATDEPMESLGEKTGAAAVPGIAPRRDRSGVEADRVAQRHRSPQGGPALSTVPPWFGQTRMKGWGRMSRFSAIPPATLMRVISGG